MHNIIDAEWDLFSGNINMPTLSLLHDHYSDTNNYAQKKRILHILSFFCNKDINSPDGKKTIFICKGDDSFFFKDNSIVFHIDKVKKFIKNSTGLLFFIELLKLPDIECVLISIDFAKKHGDLSDTLRLFALSAGKKCNFLSNQNRINKLAHWKKATEADNRLAKMLDMPTEVALPTFYGPCNIRCRFCEQAYMKVKHREVDWGVFTQAIAVMPDGIPLKTQLTPFQEPLTIKSYFKYLEYALKEKPELKVGFNTNGSNLTADIADRLVDIGLKYIIISLNMPDPESYEWFTGRDCFDQVVAGIKHLNRVKIQKQSLYPHVTVQFLNIPPVIGQEKTLADQWREFADSVSFRNISSPSCSPERMAELKERFSDDLINAQIPRPESWPCYNMFVQMNVDFWGSYRPCNNICNRIVLGMIPDPDILATAGTIFDMDLLTAWRSPAYNKMRMLQITGLGNGCSGCEYNQLAYDKLLGLRNSVYKRFYGIQYPAVQQNEVDFIRHPLKSRIRRFRDKWV